MIVDVDSHWEVERYADGEFPLEPWRDRLPPDRLAGIAHGVAGDLLASLPADRRPSPPELFPGLLEIASRTGGPAVLHPVHESSARERVDWMDQVGIDHCLVNPGAWWQMLEYLGAERADGARRCNDFLTDQLADAADRLHAVAVLDLSDPAVAVAEMEHARERGARAFFLYTVKGKPPTDVSPGHPRWDPVWTAATRLGMLAVIHVGNTSTDFDGWADIGWEEPGGAGISGLTRLANTQRWHAAQNLLSAMLYGGVFARHPNLTVLLAELRINWVPPFLQTLAAQAEPSFILGDWPWESSGAEMLRRHVRVTPLPGFGDVRPLDYVREDPDTFVFSSDYPHHEGNADPISLYGPELDALDGELRASFLGGNIEECFARMGDPLPAR
jgi:predicted TIM-barrel fold metal-dependent hydrolase